MERGAGQTGTDGYGKSRSLFLAEVACASAISNLVAGVLLSGYLDHLGISPKLNGIISAIPIISTVFQPLGAVLGGQGMRCKRFVVAFAALHRLLFAAFYCLPLWLRVDARAAAAVLIFGCSNSLAALITPSATNWLMELTPDGVRQEYFSRREIALVGMGAASSLVMGFVLQYFTGIQAPEQGYHILAGAILAFAVLNILSLAGIRPAPEPPRQAEPKKRAAGAVLLAPLRDVRFRRVIAVICLYQFGIQCALPFWGIHTLATLKLSYLYLTVLNVAVSLGKVLVLKVWLKMRPAGGWSQVCVFSFAAIAASHLLNALALEGMAVWYMLIPSACGTVGWALVGMATLNFEYDNMDGTDRAVYIGMVAVASGLVGFLGTLAGGVLMDLAAAWPLVLGGRPVSGQQLQMVLSCALVLGAAGYLKRLAKRGSVR